MEQKPLTLTRLQSTIHYRHMAEWRRLIEIFQQSGDIRLEKRAHKIRDCCYRGGLFLDDADPPDVRVWVHRCMDRLCPLCSRFRASRVRNQLREIIQVAKSPRHMVLTLKGIPGRPLADSIRKLKTCFKLLRRLENWSAKVAGGAFVIEVTRNHVQQTWHAHLHIIYEGLYYPHRMLAGQWWEVTGDSKNIWIAPIHQQSADRLSNYAGKPTDMKNWTMEEINEYAIATQSLRMVQTFGSFHAMKISDADAKPDLSQYTHFISFRNLRQMVARGNPVCRLILGYICDRHIPLRGLAQGLLDLPPPTSPWVPRDDEDAFAEAIGHPARALIRYCEDVHRKGREVSTDTSTPTCERPKKNVSQPRLFETARRD